MKFTRIIILVIIIVIIGISWALKKSKEVNLASSENSRMLTHNQIAGPAYLKKDAVQLKGTIITPHMEQKIVMGKNLLWCSTFQLAWNELCDLGKGPIKLKPASSMAEILNKRSASKADIDDASYVAIAGFTEDGVFDKIKQELKRKFNGQESPDLLDKYWKDGTYIAYGYLYKSLPFEWAFNRFSDKLTFQGMKVESFGIEQYLPDNEPNEAKMAKQVSIIDFKNDDDFIIELKTLKTTDHLILAKVTPQQTLQKTVQMVQRRMTDTKPTELTESASLFVPVLDFDLLRDYSELTSHEILSSNKRLNGRELDAALQSIRFRLDETGTVMKSEALMMDGISMHNLIFNKPFLILLQRDGSRNPYFALWVGNTELLLPAGTGK